jgi:2-polyprenyl-3-methyl-5-hydroxy-6-metoxy-1,4-benzoquinol methylase
MEAIHARAENLDDYSVHADIFLSFEMLEHLFDPVQFLHKLSETGCRALVVTIPYLAQSRVGLHHIRHLQYRNVSAENTHIFELSPEDWRLIFLHSGWQIHYDNIYLQYPSNGLWRLTKTLWKNADFEGFYGAVLVKENDWSRLYKDW